MYPDCEAKPIDIASFANLEGVIDAVYNPLCTNLVLDARARGIRAEGGLYMLVAQAVRASEIFTDTVYPHDTCDKIFKKIKMPDFLASGLAVSIATNIVLLQQN